MNYQELIEQLRKGFGTAAGRATQINFYHMWCQKAADAIESLLDALDVAEGEVKRTATERDAALAALAKYRDAPVVAWNGGKHGCEWTTDKAVAKKWLSTSSQQAVPLIIKPDENK